MKKLVLIILVVFASLQLFAQFQFNPQVGMSMMGFYNTPDGYKYKAKAGASVGADFRFGEVVQFIPGVHLVIAKTATETIGGVATVDDVKHNYLKLKGLVGLNIVDQKQIKFRVNAGPAYDFMLSAKLKDTDKNIKDDFKNGTFFLQGGVGIDVMFLTADLGYAYGLTKTFANEAANDAKTSGLYFTVGLVFGSGKK